MGNLEVLFYNALLVLIPAVLVSAMTGDLEKAYYYEHWTDAGFIVTFVLSGIMGLVVICVHVYCLCILISFHCYKMHILLCICVGCNFITVILYCLLFYIEGHFATAETKDYHQKIFRFLNH